jgi:hypothetical protein
MPEAKFHTHTKKTANYISAYINIFAFRQHTPILPPPHTHTKRWTEWYEAYPEEGVGRFVIMF